MSKGKHAAVRGRRAAPKQPKQPSRLWQKIVAAPATALLTLTGAGFAHADTWGPDISRWQGNINVSGAGDFVIMKVGGSDIGRAYKDPQFDNNLSKVRAAGKQAGYYWYNGYGSAKSDAQAFVTYLNGRYRCGEPVAYDAEESKFISPAKAHEFLTEVSNLLGWDCVNRYAYMSSSVTGSYNWSSVAEIAKLWVANYGTNNGRYQYSPSVRYWAAWSIHQYTSVGRISSYSGNIDLNRARAGAWTTTAGQTSTTATVAATNTSAALNLDGLLGYASISKAQALAGTPVDGEVWGQVASWKSINYRLTARQTWTASGSVFVLKYQRELKAAGYYYGDLDGIWGRKMNMAIQRAMKDRHPGFYTGKIDGILGWKQADGMQRVWNTGSLI